MSRWCNCLTTEQKVVLFKKNFFQHNILKYLKRISEEILFQNIIHIVENQSVWHNQHAGIQVILFTNKSKQINRQHLLQTLSVKVITIIILYKRHIFCVCTLNNEVVYQRSNILLLCTEMHFQSKSKFVENKRFSYGYDNQISEILFKIILFLSRF